MALAVANRYAQALVDVLLEAGAGHDARQVLEQLRALEQTLEASPDLRTILLNPAVPPTRKRAVVSRLAELLGMGAVAKNFALVVVDRRRIQVFGEIRQAVEDLLDESLGLVRADVSSAAGLTGEQRGRLEEEISKITGRQVRCEYTTDEDLLGGAVVQVGSTVYDGSVRGRLETLRNRLVE